MEKESSIYVAGHAGLVGSAIVRMLNSRGLENIIVRTSAELDLTNQFQVDKFFRQNKIEYVFLAAGKVGGIQANVNSPAEFIHKNILIAANVIDAAYRNNVKKLLYFGSSCIYPKNSDQPIKESALLSGYPEESNRPYAISKIAGIEMIRAYRKQYGCNFISCMPCNLYGPNDNYDAETSHVIAAIIRKVIDAKASNASAIHVWGTGLPRREFLHSDDLANACFLLMNDYNSDEIINVGSGIDVSISELVQIICDAAEYHPEIYFDHDKPNGTLRKVLDISNITGMGWKPKISLVNGIKQVINDLSSQSFPFERRTFSSEDCSLPHEQFHHQRS